MVAVLFSAGNQVPVIPLLDVVGSGDNVPPEHIGATAVKAGTKEAPLTVIVKVAVVAHCPVLGVNVYVVVAVLFRAGDQVPVIPLLEVVGNGDNTPPEQIGATAVNVGVTVAVTVMVPVALRLPQPPVNGIL